MRALIVFLKYMRQLILRDADAAIPDLDPNFVTRASAAQQNCPPIRISHRVRQQISQHCFEHSLVATDQEFRTDQAPPHPLLGNGIEEIGCQGIKHFIDREVALRRTEIPGLQTIDIEQARQNAGHGVERSRYSADKVASLPIREVRLKCRVQESQGLQWLSQVMAGSG